MISAEQFIAILEKKDLLEPETIADLRNRIEQSMAPVSAALLAKRLVDKGHLSRKLAQRLLDRAESELAEIEKPSRSAGKPKQQASNDADLGLAPLEEDEDDETDELEDVDLKATESEDWELKPLDDEPPVAREQSPPKKAPAAKPIVPPRPAEQVAAATPVEGLEEIPALGEPLDGLIEDGALGGEPLEGPLAGPRRKRRWKRGKGGKKENVWDSGLLLIGGGSLLFLVLVGLVLVWVLSGRTGEEMLATADEYYHNGSYTKAIDAYSQYLEKFPNHADSGAARVRLSLARMRQATQGGDWGNSLEVATTEIQAISGEELFASEARPELASMLPDIAEGLAKKAHANQDSATADLADQGLALVEKYLPSSARPQKRIDDIEALIALTRREIARTGRLQATVAEIGKAAEEGRTGEGYQLRRALLKEYPVLLDDASLAEAVMAVSRAEQSAVEHVEKPAEAFESSPDSAALVTVALAQRSVQEEVDSVRGKCVVTVAGSAAYGIDAAAGEVAWRQEIGLEASVRGTAFPPTPISDQPDADWLLVSRQRQEVVRVEASSGKIRWRFPVGEIFDAHPAVAQDVVLLGTRSGRLFLLDLETGNSTGYIQMPQALRVAPLLDSRRDSIYQVGEHSSLFVLKASDFTCREVVYLAHEAGSIVVPPVLVSRYLILCENDGVNDSVLKVLDVEPTAEGDPFGIVQRVRLKGHVHNAPLVDGQRLLVATDAGAISVFQFTGRDEGEPMSKIADGVVAGEGDREMIRYALMQQGRLWIADSQLTQYDVRALRGRLQPRWIANEGSVSLQPPMACGDAVVHVRTRRGVPGVVVSAVDSESGQTRWETTLAAPPAAAPLASVDEGRIVAVSAAGAVFSLPNTSFAGDTIEDEPSAALPPAELRGTIVDAFGVEGGGVALIPDGDAEVLPVYRPDTGSSSAGFRRIFLADPLAGPAVAFAGGVLAPCASGQVFLMDPQTGNKSLEPFQPRLEAGQTYRWSAPAVLDESEFLVANNHGGLYRVVVQDSPAKHLAAAAETSLADPIASPIAVLGQTAYSVDITDALVAFDLPDLAAQSPRPLGAKCVYGPILVGEHVVLGTNDNVLHVIDGQGKIRTDPLPYGVPVGPPAVDANQWLFCSAQGVIWRVDPSTGEEIAKAESGLALHTGLVPVGDRILAGGYDGSLYVLEKP